MEKMNFSLKKMAVFVSFLFIVCSIDQNPTPGKENAKTRVECNLYINNILCVDEKQNTFTNFSDIPETTNVLILRNKVHLKEFHVPTVNKLVNITKLELIEPNPFSRGTIFFSQDILQTMQSLESLTISYEWFRKNHLSNITLRLPKLKYINFTSYAPESLPRLPFDFYCSFPRLEKLIIRSWVWSDLLDLPCGRNSSCCSHLRWIEIESNDYYKRAFRVAVGAFSNFPNLQVLYIDSRRIIYPRNLLLTDFPKLTNLQMFINYANIDFLHQLKSMTELAFLGLFNYDSKSVRFQFNNLSQLTALDLKQGKIEHISSESFKNCSNLTLLDLSYNNIYALTTYESGNVVNILTTDGLPRLKYLLLAQNKIQQLDYSMIPETVKVLDVSHNPLRSLSDNENSCNNHVLVELHANCALLMNLEHVCFPPFLEVISMKHSLFSSLSAKTFTSSNNLKELLMDGNNLFKVDLFALSSNYRDRVPANIYESECSCKRFLKPFRNLSTVLAVDDQLRNDCRYTRTCGGPGADDYETTTISNCSSLMLQEFPSTLLQHSNEIYLDGNHLTTVDFDRILQQYRDMNVLYLNKSNVHEIEMTDEHRDYVISSLKEIHLEDNSLEFMLKYYFVKLRNVSSHHLQRNSFKQFQIFIYELLFLKELHLENNSISEFVVENQFKFEYRINSVYLQFNEFSKINASFCDYKIAILHLENNKISDLIFNCERLKNSTLEQLYLQNNHLTVLNSSTFNNLPSLQELNLEKNRIQQIKNKAFSRLPGLKRLNLRRNEIEEIDEGMFYEVNNLEVLNLDENSLVEIPPLVFKDLEKLRTLYLNGNKITTLSLDLFRNYRELNESHLNNNNNNKGIVSHASQGLLSLDEFHRQPNRKNQMTKLFLHHNEIHHVDKDTFKDLTSLEILTLHENKLKQPEIWNFGLSTNIKSVTIHQNPFLCECEYLKDLRNFLINKGYISNISQIKCSATKEEEYFLDQSEDFIIRLCQSKKLTTCLSVSIGSLLLFGFIAVLLYRYRLAIQVVFYSRLKIRFCYDASMDEGKQYDAFVAYSYDDRAFVADELVPRLGDYRLCIHDRDFVVGLFIQENIINAVNNSSCTLMIVSKSFVKSEWCKYEFRTAYERTLKDRWRRILVILIEDVNEDDLEDEMQFYLSTTTYLRWGDPLFWEKLYYALPSPTENDGERNHRPQDIPLQQLN